MKNYRSIIVYFECMLIAVLSLFHLTGCNSDRKIKHTADNPRCSFQGDVSETVKIMNGLEKTKDGYKIRILWENRKANNGKHYALPTKILNAHLTFGLECPQPFDIIKPEGVKSEVTGEREITLEFITDFFKRNKVASCSARRLDIAMDLRNEGYTRKCSWGSTENRPGIRFIVLKASILFNKKYSKILESNFEGYDVVEF